MNYIALLLYPGIIALQVIYWIFDFPDPYEDYCVYTHRRGWIHCSKMTKQDKKEISGFMAAYY